MTTIRIAAGILALAVIAVAQDSTAERKLLEGAWLPTRGERAGVPLDEKVLKAIKLVITGDNYTVTIGNVIDKGTVKIDAGKTPKTMEILGVEGPNKGKTILAIYEVKGDTLRICYDLAGKERPGAFATKKGDHRFLANYQRAK